MQKKPYVVCLLAFSLLGVCWYISSSPIQHMQRPGFLNRPAYKRFLQPPTSIRNSTDENKNLTSSVLETTAPEPTEGQTLTSTERTKLTVDDIGFTIKTSEKFHSTRIDLILKTWFVQTNGQINFITDGEDTVYQEKSGNKLIKSGCGKSHGLVDLCCKVGREYDTFMADTSKRWWCHFDDDNYVNVGSLVNYLDQFDDKKDWYIGRKSRPSFKSRYRTRWYVYEFGTGGGGVCISRPLAIKMEPYCGNGVFPKTCQAAGAADDCVIGLIATKLIGTKMTESPLFHSHIERLGKLNSSTLTQQACVSYNGKNVVNLPASLPQFSKEEDPTRILSLHCNIYPKENICAPLAKT
uniref:Fringe 1 n=1 Tax=Phallusia mammillata TaxID=59560 RepID=A0A6F9DQ15_9ASCI|nr:Fringe 1 [Phallusia mammillata]